MYLLAVCVSFVEPVLKFFVHSFRKKNKNKLGVTVLGLRDFRGRWRGPGRVTALTAGERRGRADRLRRRRGCRDTEQDP